MRDPGSAPALFTDLYELTMLQAYFEEGMDDEAVFSLFVRRLPEQRNYLLACGLDELLSDLEALRFDEADLAALADQGFPTRFLEHLRRFRFRGDVFALPEGTPCFADEPLVEVVAPIQQAQLVETLVINRIHLQTLLASKAARVVHAARGLPVLDFGMRRAHGIDAAQGAARAFHVAGGSATSNVAAGQRYGIPVAGTMAHSYVQAHDDESDAFRRFAGVHPDSVLLVDTYDTERGVERVVALARELGDRFRVRGVRLDSGDLAELARRTRRRLDEAGLRSLQIFASGSLDEQRIQDLLEAGAPIDGFGVGTRMAVSADAPSLDIAYKLVAYAGRGRMKLSTGKAVLPERKQVFRFERDGRALRDVIARHDETLPGRPLLRHVMTKGRRIESAREPLAAARERAHREIERLPERIRALPPADPPYPVTISDALERARETVRDGIGTNADRPHRRQPRETPGLQRRGAGAGDMMEPMFRHILAPVDLSERNDHTLRQVVELAEPGTTVVTLLHVIETIRGVEFEELADFYRDLETKAEQELQRLREGLEKQSLECHCAVRYGPRGTQILEFAAERDCDLIVLTSHRASPDRPHGGIGTTSHQVALLAHCAVLLLR